MLYADPALLTPFENARAQAPQLLDQLRDHLRDDPNQLSRLDRITQQLAQSISLSELIIERKRADTGQTTELTQFGDRAMATTKSIRLLVDEIDMAETERLANARSSWKAELRDARTIEIAMCALTLAVIVLAAWVLARLRRLAPAPASGKKPGVAANRHSRRRSSAHGTESSDRNDGESARRRGRSHHGLFVSIDASSVRRNSALVIDSPLGNRTR